MTYEQWTAELIRVAIANYRFPADTADQFRDPAWKDFYDDGYSPEDALLEDLGSSLGLAGEMGQENG